MVWRSTALARRVLRSSGIACDRSGPATSASARAVLHTERSSAQEQPWLVRSAVLAASAATAIAGYNYCGSLTTTTTTQRENAGSNDNNNGVDNDNDNDNWRGMFLERFTPHNYSNSMTATTNCQGGFFGGTNDDDAASSSSSSHNNNNNREAKLKRKKTALQVAANLRKMNTKEEISKLRVMKDEMLRRWERDEEGWRELPARAWPEYQPNPQELGGIVAEIQRLGCNSSSSNNNNDKVVGGKKKNRVQSDEPGEKKNDSEDIDRCKQLLFDMATCLVFYNVDPEGGFALYEKLAKQGHTPSMVGCGIVLVEGLGVPPREMDGVRWLEKAMDSPSGESSASSSSSTAAQAMYELGTVYYTGIDGVVEEDPERAFALFERAAKLDHTAALYMVADCLVEGEGTERSVAKAVPLFYKAAERGHRYSRQRIRELLARVDYPL